VGLSIRILGRIQAENFHDVSNSPAMVVRKEDQHAMDTTLRIEWVGMETLNLFFCETNPH